MILGMFFEVLLLKNLLTLLNYLTNSNTDIPEIIFYISEKIQFNDITIVVLLVFIFTFLLKTLVNILVKWKESKFIYTIKAQISEKLFTGYMSLPLIFHQRTNTSKLLKNITLEIEQFAIFIFSISKLILEILVMLGISTYLLFVDFYTSSFCILAFILFGYLFNFFNKNKLRSMSKKESIIKMRELNQSWKGWRACERLSFYQKRVPFLIILVTIIYQSHKYQFQRA